jgi:thioredoxin reductase/thiol-disulfide isomerase/thioredoxin
MSKYARLKRIFFIATSCFFMYVTYVPYSSCAQARNLEPICSYHSTQKTLLKFMMHLKNLESELASYPVITYQGNCIFVIKQDACSTCQRMAPLIEEAQKQFAGTVRFEIIESHQAQNHGFSVTTFPAIIYYQHGKPIYATGGYDPYFIPTIQELFAIFINPNNHQIITESTLTPLDVVIIGSGPAGLSATAYAARNQLRSITLTGEHPGGTIMQLQQINNWPGMAAVTGSYIAKLLLEDSLHLGAHLVYDTACEIVANEHHYLITTKLGNTIKTHTILFAMGTTHILPEVVNIENYLGKNVAICAACDAGSYKDKSVIIYGNDQEASHHLRNLSPMAQHITLIIPEASINPTIAQAAQECRTSLEIIINWHMQTLIGTEEKVNTITIVHTSNPDEQRTMATDGLFIALGLKPNTALGKNLVTIDDRGFIQIDNHYACTSINSPQSSSPHGLFAAGDIANPGLKQAIIASAQGLNAMVHIQEYLQSSGLI